MHAAISLSLLNMVRPHNWGTMLKNCGAALIATLGGHAWCDFITLLPYPSLRKVDQLLIQGMHASCNNRALVPTITTVMWYISHTGGHKENARTDCRQSSSA
jgi:hypothetical protein